METTLRVAIGSQFGAAIDMLDNALRACPDDLWRVCLWNDPSMPSEFSEFWYVAYHTLFWLDLYLSGAVDGFTPPAPFTLDELDPAGLLPDRVYTKDELRSYLDHSRQKCKRIVEALTDKRAAQRCKFTWGEVSFVELLLDNMRHVQEHAAQLNLILGQNSASARSWVATAKSNPGSGRDNA